MGANHRQKVEMVKVENTEFEEVVGVLVVLDNVSRGSIKDLFDRFKNAKKKVEVRVKIGTQVKDFTFEEFSERLGFSINEAEEDRLADGLEYHRC
jgi:hypothetical protein